MECNQVIKFLFVGGFYFYSSKNQKQKLFLVACAPDEPYNMKTTQKMKSLLEKARISWKTGKFIFETKKQIKLHLVVY